MHFDGMSVGVVNEWYLCLCLFKSQVPAPFPVDVAPIYHPSQCKESP